MGWENQAELDRYAATIMRQSKIPGLSLGLAKNGRVLVSKGFGYRDRERGLPATSRTVYGIASMTKSFTALAILRLAESGQLRLRDPVVRHLPEFATPQPRWTRRTQIHHFLTNSSGLPPLPSIYYSSARSLARDPPYDPKVARRVGIETDRDPIDTYEQMLEYLRTTPYRLLGPPGRFFSYSNEAFGLLGAIIERVSGRSYESYLEAEILRPAGMRQTTFDVGVMFRSPEVTTLYSPKWKGHRHGLIPSQEWWDDTCLRGCGGLKTNIEDLHRYLEIFRTGGRIGSERIVGRECIAVMTRPHIAIQPGLFYGYGVAVLPDYHGTQLVLHPGGLKGVSSMFAVAPRKSIGGAVLANAEQVPAPRVLHGGINLLLGLPIRTALADVPPNPSPSKTLNEYSGWYCSGEGIWIRVRRVRSTLRLDFVGIEVVRKNVRLRPNGDDEFILGRRGRLGYNRFLRDSRGRIWAMFEGWRLVRRRTRAELRKAHRGRMIW